MFGPALSGIVRMMTRVPDCPHNFSELDYRTALSRLFRPGPGRLPPELAGRETEQTYFLRRMLGLLKDGEAPPREMVLYGPRGNGKTVLLADFKRRAQADKVDVLSLTPGIIDSPAGLARALLSPADAPTASVEKTVARVAKAAVAAAQAPVRERNWAVDSAHIKVPGVGALSLGALSPEQLKTRLPALLTARCRARPLLVTVDEAHTLDSEVGQRLLNLSQQLGSDDTPFGLILAGTPQLRARLSRINASFWSRAEIKPIGRISPAATVAALTNPLSALSVSVEPAARAAVVDDTQRYPYFIQLWGEALCDVLLHESQGHTVTPATVEQARAQVEGQRQHYYGERYDELKDRDLLTAGQKVATVFENANELHEDTIKQALREDARLDDKAIADTLEQLSALGYTWSPTGDSDRVEPGIPSLMAHVQEKIHKATSKN